MGSGGAVAELSPGPVPLYFQIAEILRRELVAKYRPGDRVGSEPELIARFGVSRITARQALALLERDGLVVRRPAKGTFLAHPKIELELSGLTGFVEDMTALGLMPSARVVRRPLSRSMIPISQSHASNSGAGRSPRSCRMVALSWKLVDW